jgi:uncharacterized membrane protein HdeD (DUF308 family)
MMNTKDDDTSRTIASLAGPVLIAVAAFLLLNRKDLPQMAPRIAEDWGLVVLSGVILLVAGLAMVQRHNVWETSWRVLVSLVGWLAVAGGFARILYPRQLAEMAGGILANPPNVVIPALLLLFVGSFLTLKGYRLL